MLDEIFFRLRGQDVERGTFNQRHSTVAGAAKGEDNGHNLASHESRIYQKGHEMSF